MKCLIQLVNKSQAVIVTDSLNREIRSFEFARVITHNGSPQGLGDFGLTDMERTQPHLVDGENIVFKLLILPYFICEEWSHHELSPFHLDHVEINAIYLEIKTFPLCDDGFDLILRRIIFRTGREDQHKDSYQCYNCPCNCRDNPFAVSRFLINDRRLFIFRFFHGDNRFFVLYDRLITGH